jgi:hypothetical protein
LQKRKCKTRRLAIYKTSKHYNRQRWLHGYLDFYQKKGNEWRIVQMSPDDYTKFNLERIITPSAFELPTNNTNSFITTNVRLFDPADDKVYNQGNLRWPLGDPVGFKTFNTFYR